METHPLITHQVARARHDERVARGLSVYRTLGDERPASGPSVAAAALRRRRLLGRLIRWERAGRRIAPAGWAGR